MAIRIRCVDGVVVALCAAESDPMLGDHYIDDASHYALGAKFAQDWRGSLGLDLPEYPEEWAVMASQKKRDARKELDRWLESVSA
jgi:hypothetical protein